MIIELRFPIWQTALKDASSEAEHAEASSPNHLEIWGTKFVRYELLFGQLLQDEPGKSSSEMIYRLIRNESWSAAV